VPDGLYARLASLPLVVEGYELERRERRVSSGFTRVTTVVVLKGGGHAGVGEDVTYTADDHQSMPADLGLAGRHTLSSFSDRLDGLQLFPQPPQMSAAHDHRRWAFESAALDLALRQAGITLGAALDLTYHPVRFVVSTRLDIRSWLALYPQLEFKLDPTPEWDDELMAVIAGTGSVRVVDFKAFYTGTPVDNPVDADLYARVVDAFPQAVVEDAALTTETEAALGPALERLSYDAPVHSWADVAGLPRTPRFLNVKPSRFGTVQRLFEFLERAAAAGIALYGGGQFELGPGRAQIQALASLFYPKAPNDVAPSGYNAPEPGAGLPGSPLPVPVHILGFDFSDGA
jgi:hypothetical protein